MNGEFENNTNTASCEKHYKNCKMLFMAVLDDGVGLWHTDLCCSCVFLVPLGPVTFHSPRRMFSR